MTSEERREVAGKLRQMADAHDAVEASHVARALGLEYKVYGTVVAFSSADVHDLADLIDPTCDFEESADNDEFVGRAATLLPALRHQAGREGRVMGEYVGLVLVWLASLVAALLLPLVEWLIWDGWYDE